MGVDVNPIVIIGVKASAVVTTETETETFDTFNERGEKTGESKTLTKHFIKATVNGVEKKELGCDVDELIDFKGDLNVTRLTYEGKPTLKNQIIGLRIMKVDAMYGYPDDTSEIPYHEVNKAFARVKTEIKEIFGVDVEPSVFLHGNCSY